jgi:putative copper resistance protein D
MAELAVIVCRLVQYSAASVLMGSALFFVYALPGHGPGSAAELRWPRPLLTGAALLLMAGALFGLFARTAVLAGSFADALTAESLTAVVTQMDLGKAALARAALALAALVYALILPSGRALWLGLGALGAFATATIGWMGHGGATDDGGHALHLAADLLHALAAALWLGALAAFAGLVASRRQSFERLATTAEALRRFSPLGIALVATLAVTGLVNGWFLIGLAALHRQQSVPALAARIAGRPFPQGEALASLRRSLLAEALLGFAILALVAWFGTLPPPGVM